MDNSSYPRFRNTGALSLAADMHAWRNDLGADVINDAQLSNGDHHRAESTAPVAVGCDVIGRYRCVGT